MAPNTGSTFVLAALLCAAPAAVAAERISFYESSGPVLAVVARGREEIAVILELSGEGSTWLHPLRLKLDSTGQRLALETVGMEGAMRRVRCSGT